FAAGDIPKIPLNLALLKERSVIGVYWGDWTQHDPAGHQRNVKQLVDWLVAGKIKPVISVRVSLADAPTAMARLVQRQAKGKIVVLPEV
ncbi:MAG TPA: zinc-binding dehydrogenase, partial [Anaerolineae bacterium]|nr:zinc-binding dehydrogenase [Anaerolineae bacterium]